MCISVSGPTAMLRTATSDSWFLSGCSASGATATVDPSPFAVMSVLTQRPVACTKRAFTSSMSLGGSKTPAFSCSVPSTEKPTRLSIVPLSPTVASQPNSEATRNRSGTVSSCQLVVATMDSKGLPLTGSTASSRTNIRVYYTINKRGLCSGYDDPLYLEYEDRAGII